MFSPLALVLIPLGCLSLWPLVDHLLNRREANAGPLQIALTAFCLSTGGLALILMWAGLLPGRRLTPLTALAIVAVGWGAGLLLNHRWISPRRWYRYWLVQWKRLARLDIDALCLWAVIGVSAVIAVSALYYPFVGDDTLTRYGLQAQAIYADHRIPDTISGYPPLVPLTFVVTWFAAGQPNEHLAQFCVSLMAIGTVGATYLLGSYAAGRRFGSLAAAIVALTPMFVKNATIAYIDIPTAFPLTLATLYSLRWRDSGQLRDGVLAGILLGVALLTKQSAMTWLISLAAIPLLWSLSTRGMSFPARWQRAVSGLAGILLPALLLSAPWYVRNYVLGGWTNVVPIAGLYHLLGPGIGWLGLVPPLTSVREFGLALAPLYAVGWPLGLGRAVWQGWRALRDDPTGLPTDLALAVAIIPYWLAWWTRFSFDPRFLLLILPLMAMWAARPLAWMITQVGRHVRLPHTAWQIGGVLLLLGLLAIGTSERIGSVYWTVTQPFAPDDERLLRAKGSMYDLVLYARYNLDPATDRLAVMDARMVYYLGDQFEIEVMYPTRLEELEGYDYLFFVSAFYSVYADGRLGWETSEFYQHAFDPLIFETVYESEGVRVVRVLRTTLPTLEEYEAYRATHPEGP